MRSKKRLTSSLVTFTIFLFLATASPAFAADKEKVLHNFGDEEDGASPNGGLIFDAAGNLYGTTYYGGGGNCGYDTTCGTVFQLTPSGNGKWKESVILLGSQAGDNPAAGLILDAAGNLYGTAPEGIRVRDWEPSLSCHRMQTANGPRRSYIVSPTVTVGTIPSRA